MQHEKNVQDIINKAYANIDNAHYSDLELVEAINIVFEGLDCGALKVAEHSINTLIVNDWIKKAILLYFKIFPNKIINVNNMNFFCKTESKYKNYTAEMFKKDQIRVVPGAVVRKGSYIGKNSLIMPSFINIGANIGSNSTIDTWATVGSCAQIGSNVHISGGAGIGGVLEPLQDNPTIIEDDCFIGARSEIVEGVIVGKGSVISMGVFLSQSTKIYDKANNKILYGKVPEYSVVVPGSLPSNDKTHNVYAAIIIKTVDEKTRRKVSINDLLRSNN